MLGMQPGVPSRTARGAALQRAVHQLVEQGRIFNDPLAVRILGEDVAALRERAAHEDDWRRGLRFFLVVRSRFAEDALARAVQAGVHQLIVLGAGLDTFAYRNPHASLRVFEVDHPATQSWKRERLTQAGIELPRSLRFVAYDFEHGTLPEALRGAGFDPRVPTFVFWLGVVVYLAPEAMWSTLRYFAGLPAPAHVVFDYANPLVERGAEFREAVQQSAARVAAAGEPWINFLDTPELHATLRAAGFCELEDLGPPEMIVRYASQAWPASSRGGHVIRASSAAL